MVFANSHEISRVSWYSGNGSKVSTFRIKGYHPLWLTFPGNSSMYILCNFVEDLRVLITTPITPMPQRPQAWHDISLGCSPFARRYLENRYYFLLLRVLRCFNSPGITTACAVLCSSQRGFPIRKSTGQCLLPTNRSLSQVTTSFIIWQCQGIHRTPLNAWPYYTNIVSQVRDLSKNILALLNCFPAIYSCILRCVLNCQIIQKYPMVNLWLITCPAQIWQILPSLASKAVLMALPSYASVFKSNERRITT